jgi:hypothetical protein
LTETADEYTTRRATIVLDFFGARLVIEPSQGRPTGDPGLLPVRQFDERIGLTQAFAEALDDPRDPGLTEHTFLECASVCVPPSRLPLPILLAKKWFQKCSAGA